MAKRGVQQCAQVACGGWGPQYATLKGSANVLAATANTIMIMQAPLALHPLFPQGSRADAVAMPGKFLSSERRRSGEFRFYLCVQYRIFPHVHGPAPNPPWSWS